jgi:hypothetical protein
MVKFPVVFIVCVVILFEMISRDNMSLTCMSFADMSCADMLCVFRELVLNTPDISVIQFVLPIIIFVACCPIVITPGLSMPPNIGTE